MDADEIDFLPRFRHGQVLVALGGGRVAVRPDWVRDADTFQAWRTSLVSPGTLVALPQKFACRLCGCEAYVVRHGMKECAWCGGHGRTIGPSNGHGSGWCHSCGRSHAGDGVRG